MPYRKIQFINDGIYHIVVRAIDGNLLFKDINDYSRGIVSIYEFNNAKPVLIRERRKTKKDRNRGPSSEESRDKLVEVLAFCLMPNHFHLLVKQSKDEGVAKFMSKLNTGYGGYFNRRYERRGHVFQNRFVAVHIESEKQLKTVFVYIHVNPVSLIEPKWKEKGIQDPSKCIEFLESYKWSSYADYLGKINFPSITNRKLILKIMGGEKNCKEFVESWINYKGELNEEFIGLALD